MGNIIKKLRKKKHNKNKNEDNIRQLIIVDTYNREDELTPSEYSTYLADIEVRTFMERESPIIIFETQYHKPKGDAN